MEEQDIKKVVRESYAKVAKERSSCCGNNDPCGSTELDTYSEKLGYSVEDIKSIPKDSNLGLGCGNPVALASLKEGETVLDLGSGGGIDCFLAANKVGPKGKIIGVDMTPEMIDRARTNMKENGIKNVEFRLGEIENLPVPDNSVDVVISNCVINLSPNKLSVFHEIYRVLKPGGRIGISDIVLLKELPAHIRNNMDAYVSCISGAVLVDEYKRIIEASGLKNVKFTPLSSPGSSSDCCGTNNSLVSMYIEATKKY
ncbi:MAG: arsenite methyltransferase [Candidatus Hodarchaeota archaeon]